MCPDLGSRRVNVLEVSNHVAELPSTAKAFLSAVGLGSEDLRHPLFMQASD